MSLPRDSGLRVLDYLNEIDRQNGCALKWHLEKIAGNAENFKRWEAWLVYEWKLVEKVNQGDRDCYRKTTLGQTVHDSLKSWGALGPVYETLLKHRLPPSSWFPIQKGESTGSIPS